MYVYNVLFDWTRNDGGFSVTTAPGILNQSKHWLNHVKPNPPDPNPPAFDPEIPSIWEDLGDSTLLVRAKSNPGELCIRVAQDLDAGAGPPLPPEATVQLAVCFGRPLKATQAHASPLRSPLKKGRVQGANPTKTVAATFISGPIRRNTSAAWFFPLGEIDTSKAPGHPNKLYQFEFAVGVIVEANGETRYYGEDPECDIGD